MRRALMRTRAPASTRGLASLRTNPSGPSQLRPLSICTRGRVPLWLSQESPRIPSSVGGLWPVVPPPLVLRRQAHLLCTPAANDSAATSGARTTRAVSNVGGGAGGGGQQKRTMGYWTEFVKSFKESFKEQKEGNKELSESLEELKKKVDVEKRMESVHTFQGKVAEQYSHYRQKAVARGGEITSRVSDSMPAWKLSDITNQRHVSETLEKTGDTLHKFADEVSKVEERLERMGENISKSAEESELVKKVREKVPFNLLEQPSKDQKEGREGEAATGPRSQLIVKTQEVQTAIEQRLADVRDKIRATRAYKNALALREKIVESDNPLIQRALDVGDSISRATSKFFSENEYAKTIKLIQSLDPSFSTEDFKQRMASSFVPTLRSALLSGDAGPISNSMSKRLAEYEIEVLKEWDSHGYQSQSKLLHLENVEILNAHTRDDRPTLIIHFVAQENHCIRDRSGAVVEGSVNDIQDVEQTWAMQMNSKGEWEVIEYAILSSRPSW